MVAITEKGFTLLEVLLATILSAFILFAMYTTFISIRTTIATVTEERKVHESGRVLIDLLRKDLRGISQVGKTGLVGKKEEIDETVYTKIDFVTTSLLRLGTYRKGEVGYKVVKDDDGSLVLMRRESNVAGSITEGGEYFELSREIKGFNLYFFDGNSWSDEWDTGGSAKIPKAVRIEIKLKGKNDKEETFLAEETIPSIF